MQFEWDKEKARKKLKKHKISFDEAVTVFMIHYRQPLLTPITHMMNIGS